jgi:hypothetical protein
LVAGVVAVSRNFGETELIDGLEVEIVDLVVALLFGSDFRKTKIIKDVEWDHTSKPCPRLATN